MKKSEHIKKNTERESRKFDWLLSEHGRLRQYVLYDNQTGEQVAVRSSEPEIKALCKEYNNA
jgi:hypothetical protein